MYTGCNVTDMSIIGITYITGDKDGVHKIGRAHV